MWSGERLWAKSSMATMDDMEVTRQCSFRMRGLMSIKWRRRTMGIWSMLFGTKRPSNLTSKSSTLNRWTTSQSHTLNYPTGFLVDSILPSSILDATLTACEDKHTYAHSLFSSMYYVYVNLFVFFVLMYFCH